MKMFNFQHSTPNFQAFNSWIPNPKSKLKSALCAEIKCRVTGVLQYATMITVGLCLELHDKE